MRYSILYISFYQYFFIVFNPVMNNAFKDFNVKSL